MAAPAVPPPPNPPAHHGKNGQLWLAPSAAGVPVYVALITDWSLDMATDKVETTSLGDGNKTYVQGLKDIKGTFTGQWNSEDEALFLAADSLDGCKLQIYPDAANSPGWIFEGAAWLDVSIKGGVSAAITVDGNFVAAGAWTRVTGILPGVLTAPPLGDRGAPEHRMAA